MDARRSRIRPPRCAGNKQKDLTQRRRVAEKKYELFFLSLRLCVSALKELFEAAADSLESAHCLFRKPLHDSRVVVTIRKNVVARGKAML